MRSYLVALSLVLLAACGSSKEAKVPDVPASPKAATTPSVPSTPKAPLTIAYSDWPGWVAWEIGDPEEVV